MQLHNGKCQSRGRRNDISETVHHLTVAKKELFAGRFEAAHAAAQAAIRANPGQVDAVLVMAAIAIEHGNIPGARKLCDLVDKTGVQSCWLAVLKAREALLRQDQDDARSHALKAHEIGTDDPHIANQLGVILSRTGRHDLAVDPMQLAVEQVPDDGNYRHNLAVALQFAGDLAEAEAQFRQLVKQHPDHAKAWLALVQLAKSPDDDWQAILENQFAAAKDAETRQLLGHSLARLAENAKDWDASFDWLQKAKSGKRADSSYDRAAAERLADAGVAAASARPIKPAPDAEHGPIFVVGMPRSGTTLVERILSSHSTVASVGELSDFAILLKHAVKTPGPHVLDANVLEAAAQHDDLTAVGDAYLQRTAKLTGHAQRLVDKMPFNIFYAPAILRALPSARIVCLRRSPFDVLFANYRQLFATGFSYYNYNYDFADTAHFVAQFERLADAFGEALPEHRFLSIGYEDIIADQQGMTERLLQFCGLEWEDACMEFHRNAQPVATASSVQVRSPLYSSSMEQWRRYSEASELAQSELAKYGITPD